MKLSEMQQTFCLNIAMLISWAFAQGFKVTFGESFNAAGTGHMKDSLHYIRLAQDLNLFKDGVYLTKSEDYKRLGEAWKAFNPLNRWGGDFKSPDGNHFSMIFEGRS
jgi:hypothetical protein